ncbi:helix-turn-helix domain-containing protein [Porphyrobacter algicida]|uniref:Helix-turn-helix domain-containing protein n=1 Tax=Qipengyuania algicida TaxID=1836209 RepID=A0A845AFU6_9SPHN|nr:helix-turn-helix domain-containing protein [Qipengyuania algicida]MXP27841.1 helix-turn-helix domain-containing protein [Qipengyuania algicida]
MDEGDGLTSLTGATRAGLPLAFSRAPCARLRPWIARMGVTQVDLPEGQAVEGTILSESAALRIVFGSNWSATTRDGQQLFKPGGRGMTLLFGPHSRAMPVRVSGSFAVATINLTAGANAALGGPNPVEMLDRIIDYDAHVGHGNLSERLLHINGAENWIEAIEREYLRFVDRYRPPQPNTLITHFEIATLGDPTFPLGDFAAAHSICQRTLERLVRKEMGVTPGLALRRARALDMAAVLLGVAIKEDEPELRLRYFDQSHLIREMRHFFDLTPSQFIEIDRPLLRIGVEMRQIRRIELLESVASGELSPWRDPMAEPRPQLPARKLSRRAS